MSSTPSPSVSLVITTYNHARYLREAIDSGLGQSVPPIEIIVVDDGSSDHPERELPDLPHVTIIRQTNQGLSAARNTGWRAAKGSHVAFLDADDRLLPRAFEFNLSLFERNPHCGFVYGSYRNISEDGTPRAHLPVTRKASPDPYAAFLTANCVGMHAVVLYRRACLEEVGGFDVSLRAAEDYDIYLRMSALFPVAFHEECIAEYRRHESNMSRNSAFMLKSTTGVLERQRDRASTRPDWQRAFDKGMTGWRRHYARETLFRSVQSLRKRKNVAAVASGTLATFSLAPRETTVAMVSGLRKRVQNLRSKPRLLSFGSLRRTTPISLEFGFDRGKPLDRRYIEAFLAAYAGDVKGRVLEIGDDSYARQFGGGKVTQCDVFHRSPGSNATYSGDLAGENDLPSGVYDCMIVTQTLHLILDVPAVIRTLFDALRPGGVLLLTVPWISPIDRVNWGDQWYWSISQNGLRRLLEAKFRTEGILTQSMGNVLAATAFLHGLAEHELTAAELDIHDRYCPVITAARAVKRG